jgi:hypothetical protein
LQGENVSTNGSPLRIHILALFVLSSLVLAGRPATARSGSDDAESIAVVPSSIRIYNFGRVDPNYYRGAQPKGRDYSDLAALGVKTRSISPAAMGSQTKKGWSRPRACLTSIFR